MPVGSYLALCRCVHANIPAKLLVDEIHTRCCEAWAQGSVLWTGDWVVWPGRRML